VTNLLLMPRARFNHLSFSTPRKPGTNNREAYSVLLCISAVLLGSRCHILTKGLQSV
jgi:hypothetical protein